MRHLDFERIRNEFITYYKDETKGDKEYYSWLNALHLNETLCYSQTHESFQWAKDNIRLYKEDKNFKYYKVLCAFPLKSMNGNVYHERDLIAASMRIANPKAHPSMIHKDEYWLSPENPNNHWGNIDIMGAKYEDGAVESIIKVPKNMPMPIQGFHSKMVDAFDYGDIVNVSLEGNNANYDGGFSFREDIPFTLLTRDVLPGIPLARVFPIEAYLPFTNSKSSPHKHRTIKIVGLGNKMNENKTPVGEPCSAELQACVDKLIADGKSEESAYAICRSQMGEQKEASDLTGPTQASNPIKPVVTNAGVTVKGGTGMVNDENDKKMIQGESVPELKVKTLKAEQKATAAEVARLETEQKLTEAYSEISELKGELKSLKQTSHDTTERLEKQVNDLNVEKAKDIAEKRDLTRRLEDMTTSRDGYKTELETLKTEHEKVTAKYRETLTANLALEKKLTETNEEYLTVAKKAEHLEDKVKHVNRITKITAKI